ncbi:MAG: leucine-rich repeat domain-containing protein [Alistipes sp.]
MNRFFWGLMVVGSLSACGMTEDEQKEENKFLFIQIPDQAFLHHCVNHYDSDGDGRISRYEAQHVLHLSCPDLHIQSMIGVEEFVALRTLDCSGNQLTTFDARPFKSLEELNVSRNSALSYLQLDGLQRLTALRCSNCALTNVGQDDCISLSTLECHSNRLTTLDVSGCAGSMDRVVANDNPSLTTLYKRESQRIEHLVIDPQTQIEIR